MLLQHRLVGNRGLVKISTPHLIELNLFGDKVHFDQNEKLASRKIVGVITIPTKNLVAIYHTLMQPLLHQYGLWQQVRTDCGTEFALVVTAQQYLAPH